MDREDFFLHATVALFAAFRVDAKPTLLKDDIERALDEATELVGRVFPSKPEPAPEPPKKGLFRK